MKSAHLILLAITMTFLAQPAFSQILTSPDLFYMGAPIDARCFTSLSEGVNRTINLKTCGMHHDHLVKTEGYPDLIRDGFIGTAWKGKQEYEHGSDYYKSFAAGNGHFWIYSLSNGGGTGMFSSISLVKRENHDSVTMQYVAGGDRCNGGIDDVALQGNHLTYSVNLTPYDLYQLGNNQTTKLKPYDNLASCAICCVAKAIYSVDLTLSPKLNRIEMEKINHAEDISDQGDREMCFNRIIVKNTQAGKTQLTIAELKKMVQEFNVSCK